MWNSKIIASKIFVDFQFILGIVEFIEISNEIAAGSRHENWSARLFLFLKYVI